MSDIQVFNNIQFGQVRAIERDGEPWFVGKDVAEILGYSNASKAVIAHVDDEDKHFEMMPVTDSQNGNLVKTTLINESGLYSLVLRSNLSTAKQFKRWITSEVIPSIRKYGAYATPVTIDSIIADPDFGIKLLMQLKDERDKNTALQAKVEADAPKVLFADSVVASNKSILIGELAKLLRQNGFQIGQQRLFQRLRDEGYLCKAKGERYNMPTQYAMDLELFQIKESTVSTQDDRTILTRVTKVTPKGQIFFINRYLKKGQDSNRTLNGGHNHG